MNIHVICRLNQARSIIASAALRKIFPELQIYSSGIQARNATPIPLEIRDIASRWGLEKIDPLSTLVGLGEPIADDDLLLCADHTIDEHLAMIGVPGYRIDVTTRALDSLFLPHDPILMTLPAMERELAKMIVASTRALHDYRSPNSLLDCHALIYHVNDGPSIVDRLMRWHQRYKGVVIDMGWKIPDPSIWESSGIPVTSFNPRRLEHANSSSDELSVLVSHYEIDTAIDILTSSNWYKFVSTPQRPVLLLVGVTDEEVLTAEEIVSLIHTSTIEMTSAGL